MFYVNYISIFKSIREYNSFSDVAAWHWIGADSVRFTPDPHPTLRVLTRREHPWAPGPGKSTQAGYRLPCPYSRSRPLPACLCPHTLIHQPVSRNRWHPGQHHGPVFSSCTQRPLTLASSSPAGLPKPAQCSIPVPHGAIRLWGTPTLVMRHLGIPTAKAVIGSWTQSQNSYIWMT